MEKNNRATGAFGMNVTIIVWNSEEGTDGNWMEEAQYEKPVIDS